MTHSLSPQKNQDGPLSISSKLLYRENSCIDDDDMLQFIGRFAVKGLFCAENKYIFGNILVNCNLELVHSDVCLFDQM